MFRIAYCIINKKDVTEIFMSGSSIEDVIKRFYISHPDASIVDIEAL